MAAARIALLAIGVAGVLTRPRGLPAWVVPLIASLVALATGVLGWHDAGHLLRPLLAPLAFLLAAVPLAVLLDELGFFAALAALAGRGRHLELGLWILAALVTTVLNLDAAVVLLTPLYVRIARRTGRDPLTLAFQPVVLASLTSSALPVSNLTNLLAVARWHVSAASVAAHLGPASLVAATVGWFAYRRVLLPGGAPVGPGAAVAPAAPVTPADRRALCIGGAVVVPVLLGVTVGDALGVPAWTVALAADVVLLAVLRRAPWRSLPLGAAAIAASLGLLAGSAAPHLGLRSLLGGHGLAAEARVAALAAAGANVVNNLPALLVGLPLVGARPDGRGWALLAGVNLGPVVVVSGSLAGLLWLDVVRRLGVDAGPRDYTRLGVRVGLPGALAGLAVALVTGAALRGWG
jgi:arsenical pump membrane protein